MTNNKGWECPRCHKIYAPWKAECDCPSKAIQKLETEKTVEKDAEKFLRKLQEKCEHQWELNVEKHEVKCVKCGIDGRSVPCVGVWL